MNSNISCPIDFVTINENKARLTALFVLILTVAYLLTGVWLILLFLAADFFFRAFKWGSYSVLGIISDFIIKQFKIKNKPVDRAPKRFAAGTGLFVVGLMLLLILFNFEIAAKVTGLILIFFAFLESVLSICVGCYIYAFGNKLLRR